MAGFFQAQLPWHADQYQLLDFGNGRKLERFGPFVFDRSCPAAQDHSPKLSEPWATADLKLQEGVPPAFNQTWNINFQLTHPSKSSGHSVAGEARTLQAAHKLREQLIESIIFQLRVTAYGHVGLFPEQAENWRWLFELVLGCSDQPVNCLNLFAYTGGATLAMAAAGAHVVHIDSSAPSVQWARRNAALSGLQSHPIRWIVEDAFKFIEREIRRGNRYQVIVLDPPAYGHSPNGNSWKLENTWQELIVACLELMTADSPAGLLWTGHSPIPNLEQVSRQIVASKNSNWCIQSGENDLLTLDGRRLNHGYFVRAVAS